MNKSEAERMKSLLVDAVTTLCRSGMRFNEALRVEGLLAITVDESDIMVINVNKTFENPAAAKKNKTGQNSEENVKESENDSDLSEGSACSLPAKRRRRHKHHSRRQKRDHEDMHDDSDVQAHQLSHETEASSSSSKRFKSSCLQADESYSDITHVSQYSSEDYDVKTNPPIKIEIDSDSESDDKAQLNAQLFGLNSEGEHTLTGTPVDQSVLTDAMTVPVSVYSAANYPTQGSANMTFPGTSNQEYYQQMAASELSSSPGAKVIRLPPYAMQPIHDIQTSNSSIYPCKECGKVFRWNYSLQRHKKTMHNPNKVLHECPHCTFTTLWRDNLKMHLKVCRSRRKDEHGEEHD